jgi:hypothetical protein
MLRSVRRNKQARHARTLAYCETLASPSAASPKSDAAKVRPTFT